MLLRFSELKHYKLVTSEEQVLGQLHDIYFDDASWTVRYIVMHPTTVAEKNAVLISPLAVGNPHAEKRMLPVHLKHEQIQQSPDVEERLPISRQKEIELAEYYDWPTYWTQMAARVPGVVKELAQSRDQRPDIMEAHAEESPSNLRSAKEILRYNVLAENEPVGHVDDVVAETEYWNIPLLGVDVAPLRTGHFILLPPFVVDDIRWQEKAVHVLADASKVMQAPYYDKTQTITDEVFTVFEQYFAQEKQ